MPLGDGLKSVIPGINVPAIVMTATGYYYTACYAWSVMEKEALKIRDKNEKGVYTVEMAHVSPAIVNMAFACELALKSMIKEENREHTHKIRVLYDTLQDGLQKAIKARVMSQLKLTDDTMFYNKLDECSENFVDWRYFFARGSHAGNADFHFLKSIVELILDIYRIEHY